MTSVAPGVFAVSGDGAGRSARSTPSSLASSDSSRVPTMRSRVTRRGWPSSPVTVSVTVQSFGGRPASRAVTLLS